MILVKFIDFLRDRLGLVIKACLGLLAVLVILDIAIALTSSHAPAPAPAAGAPGEAHAKHGVDGPHASPASDSAAVAAPAPAKHGFMQSLYHIAHSTPVFWSVFGFIACVLIVYISKWYGHLKIGNTEIMTREDYYNE